MEMEEEIVELLSFHEVERLVESTSLKPQMISFGVYDAWLAGTRGRKP